MKGTLLILYIFFSSMVVRAQLEPISSLFWTNYSNINPANSGVSEKAMFNFQGRSQWTQVNGHPNTVWSSADYKIEKINSGLGLNYIYDEYGLQRSNRIGLNYNYQIDMKKYGVLSLGLSAAYHSYTYRISQFAHPQSPVIDPAIPQDDIKGNRAEYGFGFVCYLSGLKIGGSFQSLPKPPTDKYLNYWQNTGYVFVETDIKLMDELILIPRAIYRRTDFEEAKEATDYHLSLKLFNKLIMGGTYRDVDKRAYNAIIGLEFKQFRLNYCYEQSDVSSDVKWETHEFSLSYFIASKEQ